MLYNLFDQLMIFGMFPFEEKYKIVTDDPYKFFVWIYVIISPLQTQEQDF